MKKILWVCISTILMISVFYACSDTGRSKKELSDGEIIASSQDAIVVTESGKVAGYIEDGIYIYKGIPYAKAERFTPPVAPDSWDAIRSSRAYGPTCPQGKRMGWYSDDQAFAFNWDDGYPDENCLRANIWTQGINDGKKRPVMVWLHGGGFSAGSGQELPSYDGKNLAKKGDVVVVTLNHRLNILGFLDLSAFGNKYKQSGNVGMLDLVAALQWVQKNISNFGGDINNVTIFGQSGGGGKVTALMSMPIAKGLFHKAIVQSGSLLHCMEPTYSREIGLAVAAELGLTPARIDELKSVPYEQLLEAGQKAVRKVRQKAVENGVTPSLLFGWAPVFDGITLPFRPSSQQAFEISKNVPVLIGSTLHEFLKSSYNPALKQMSLEEAKKEIEKQYGNKTDALIAAFSATYPGFKPIDLFDVDLMFRPMAIKQATLKAALNGAPAYMYLFTWESPVPDGALRSMHCMELPFVFNNIYNSRTMTGGTEAAYALADKMSSCWINFARTGNPNADGLPEWKSYNPEEGATMIFNNICEVKYNHDSELLKIANSE
ncbi:MAG: carboxylesterase/lipase family protein [Tannerellaceae bacterium]|jgi:para-nitrobenzyl esterase|nr:carboxylesterase/lipase family protein [Tannerellaceae bacterium]